MLKIPERSNCSVDQLLRYLGTDCRYGKYDAVYCNSDFWTEFVKAQEMKHSAELQALAVQTGNFLVSKMLLIRNRATIISFPVILLEVEPLLIYRTAYGYCRLESHTEVWTFLPLYPEEEAHGSKGIGRCFSLWVSRKTLKTSTFFFF